MRVCLNMIVRNEARVIARCLASVLPFIDCWVIIDTGSTDGTQEIIRQALADKPGRLFERPWVDQEFNRNEALGLARRAELGEYVLLIDADEVLEAEPGFVMPELTAHAYELTVRYRGVEFARAQLLQLAQPWRWIGKRHPQLRADGIRTRPVALSGLYTVPHTDGASWSDPAKYAAHAAELEAEVAIDPESPRLRYYLAQSYRDAGALGKALEAYLNRALYTQGWAEETWSALYEAAKLTERLHKPWGEVVAAYVRAYQFRPRRAEPLCRLARYLRERGDFASALLFARQAAALPRPADRLFVEVGVYRRDALLELLAIARHLEDHSTVQHAERELDRRTALTRPTPTPVGDQPC